MVSLGSKFTSNIIKSEQAVFSYIYIHATIHQLIEKTIHLKTTREVIWKSLKGNNVIRL